MQNVITMVALLTLLGSPVAIAQTVGRSSAGPARPTVSLSLARDTRLSRRASRPSPTERKGRSVGEPQRSRATQCGGRRS